MKTSTRKLFLSIAAVVAFAIGALAVLFPETLLVEVKHAEASGAAITMARTVGVLLVALGVLAFSVRNHPDTPTLRAVFFANLVVQLALLPIDPWAYAEGTFHTLGSFVPNTILHLVLAAGFAALLLRRPTLDAGAPGRVGA